MRIESRRRDKYDTPAPTVEDLIRYERDYEALVACKVEVVLHDDWQWWPDGHVMYYNNRSWGSRPGYYLRWGYWLFRFQGKFTPWPNNRAGS